jgi:xanthine/uracil/vitamin C permease (AzgA family)
MKIITGKAKEVTTAVWILAAVSAVFFVFYPY